MRFTDEKYVCKKVKQIASFGLGLTYTPNYVIEGVPFISSKNISQDFLDLSDINYISLDEYRRISNNCKPQRGDILFTRVGSNLGHPVIFDTDENLAIFVSLGYLRVKSNINNEFVKHWMNSQSFWNQVKTKIAGSSKMNLNVGWLENFDIHLPTLNSQKKIASFLNLIENRIITQKKIISNLKSLIISIKNTEFYNTKGFKEKLENILIEINEKTIINDQHEVLSSTVKGIFKQSDYFDRAVASENNIGYKIVKRGNIVVSPQNLWMGNISYNDKFDIGIVSPSYKIFNISSNYNERYIFEMLTTKKSLYLFKTVSEQGASVVRRNLNYEAFMQLTFNIPSLNEQNNFIEKLSLLQNKLSLENKILSLLEQQKQYLLDKLFI